MDFKALLLLDNAPGHPSDISEINKNIKVEYLSPNITNNFIGFESEVKQATKDVWRGKDLSFESLDSSSVK